LITISRVDDPQAKISQALDNLVGLNEMNRTAADAFLAHSDDETHRDAEKAILKMHWQAADDRAQIDPATAEAIRHELRVILEAMGWHLGITFP
jgi:hypothetical protein